MKIEGNGLKFPCSLLALIFVSKNIHWFPSASEPWSLISYLLTKTWQHSNSFCSCSFKEVSEYFICPWCLSDDTWSIACHASFLTIHLIFIFLLCSVADCHAGLRSFFPLVFSCLTIKVRVVVYLLAQGFHPLFFFPLPIMIVCS